MKVILCFLIATVVTFAADADKSCEDLNARAETLYNSTECKLVKAIILGDLLPYPPIDEVPKPDPDLECTSYCVREVVNVVEGIIDEGCEIAKEGIAHFIYTVDYNSQDFTAATDFVCEKFVDQFCEDLNARAETLYNSAECKLVKAITSGHVLSYPPIGEVPKPDSDIECTSSCHQGVVNVVKGIIDEKCAIEKEGIRLFIYPIYYFSPSFTAATDFVCQKFACVDAIRSAIDCNKNEQGTITPQCFQKTPCYCLEDFLELMEISSDFETNSSSDFNENFGLDKYGQRDIMGPMKEAFENKTCTNERQATSSAPQGRHVSSKVALPYFTVAAVLMVFFSPLCF